MTAEGKKWEAYLPKVAHSNPAPPEPSLAQLTACGKKARTDTFPVHPYLRPLEDDAGEIVAYSFWCPGCATIDRRHGLHVFIVKDADGDPEQEWSFDGEASFEPSLAYESSPYCHLHLTAGKLRYYPDSTALADQTVDMVPIPPGRHKERA